MITISGGNIRPVLSIPSDTSLTTIYEGFKGTALLLSVNISATGAADATVIISDGTTDFELLSAKSMVAKDREFLEWQDGMPVLEGYSIKVKTSLADVLCFSLVFSELLK